MFLQYLFVSLRNRDSCYQLLRSVCPQLEVSGTGQMLRSSHSGSVDTSITKHYLFFFFSPTLPNLKYIVFWECMQLLITSLLRHIRSVVIHVQPCLNMICVCTHHGSTVTPPDLAVFMCEMIKKIQVGGQRRTKQTHPCSVCHRTAALTAAPSSRQLRTASTKANFW